MNNFDQLILDTFKSLLNNHYDKITWFNKNGITYKLDEDKIYVIELSSCEPKENKPITIEFSNTIPICGITAIENSVSIKGFNLVINNQTYYINGIDRVEFAQYLDQFEGIIRRKELELLEFPLINEEKEDSIDLA